MQFMFPFTNVGKDLARKSTSFIVWLSTNSALNKYWVFPICRRIISGKRLSQQDLHICKSFEALTRFVFLSDLKLRLKS